MPETEFIEGSLTTPLGLEDEGKAPNAIVFLPKGKHTITPFVNGRPATREVNVDASAAERVQEDFEATQGSARFGDFDHERKKASFWPTGFYWDADKGVMAKVDWSKSGKEAVESKDYRYFSPSFSLQEGRVTGLQDSKPVGGLVNNPAFQTQEKIAASNTGPEPTHKEPKMKLTELVDASVLTTAQASSADAGQIIADKFKALSKEKEALAASAASARKELKDYRDEIEAAQKAEIKKEVLEHVSNEVIDASDSDFWTEQLLASPEPARKALAKMAGKQEKGPEPVFAGNGGPAKVKKKAEGFKTAQEFVDACLDDANDPAKKGINTFAEAVEARGGYPENYLEEEEVDA